MFTVIIWKLNMYTFKLFIFVWEIQVTARHCKMLFVIIIFSKSWKLLHAAGFLGDPLRTDWNFNIAAVVFGFSNHFGTKINIIFTLPEQKRVKRFCFNYMNANCEVFNSDLREINSSMFFGWFGYWWRSVEFN